MIHFWFRLLDFFGIRNEGGYGYGFFSGVGSDLGELALFGAIVGAYRHVNCHIKGCARFAHHEYEIDGVKYKLCRKHHPGVNEDSRPTQEDFERHHREHTTTPTPLQTRQVLRASPSTSQEKTTPRKSRGPKPKDEA